MKKKYKKIFAALFLFLLLAAAGVVSQRPIEVETEALSYGTLDRSFTVQAELTPLHTMILNAPASGVVSELPVKAGSQIKAGQILLKTEEAGAVSSNLQREQLKQQLNTARQEYESLYGAAGSAQSAFDAADSAYRLADKNYNNCKILADSSDISLMELEAAKTERMQAYQSYVQAGELNSQEQRSFRLEQIASCERQLEALDAAVQPAELRMPCDGILWEIYIEKGDYLEQNQPAVKIYSSEEMVLSASAPAEDAIGLQPGDRAAVVYPDGSPGEAAVTFISRTAVKELSSVGLEESRCRVELAPDEQALLYGAGQQAELTFCIVKARDVLSVPVSAIVPDGRENIAYKISAGRARAVPVKTGRTEGGRTEILEGLEKGDKVVLDPYDSGVKDGKRVRERE